MADTVRKDRVLVEVTLPAPIETVWRAVCEPDLIRNWFGWDADSLEEEVKFIFVEHSTADKERGVLQFGEWQGNSDRFELEAKGGSTLLRVVRHGPVPDGDWEDTYDDVWEGWITFAQQLRLAVQHDLGPRRTLFLSGQTKADGAPPSVALGLASLSDAQPGTRYRAEPSPGGVVSGEVWFRTPFQLGLSVEEWGSGLLIVTDKGGRPAKPGTGGSLLLTTYGQSDGEFAELAERWRAWWAERFTASASAQS